MKDNQNIKMCPDCGGDVKGYHDVGITRIVCAQKCNGYKIIQEIDRFKTKKTLTP